VLVLSGSWLNACAGGDRDNQSQSNGVLVTPPTMPPLGGSGGSNVPVVNPGSTGAAGTTVGAAGSTPVAAGTGGSAAGSGGIMNGGTGGMAGSMGMAGTMGMAGSMSMAGSGGTTAPPDEGDHSVAGVCARWKADHASVGEGMWNGATASCMAGDLSADAHDNALRVLNGYRWLVDMPAITEDPTFTAKAQQCALMMRANNSLSHMPPSTWMCYTADGSEGASHCNISSGQLVSSVNGFIVDPGNATTIGHRRWILGNMIGPTGLGGTDRSSCVWTFGTSKLKVPWLAYPRGVIPIQAMGGGFSGTVDGTGWSLQSDTINVESAEVTITSDGASMPVTKTVLQQNVGSRYAIRFNPMGWTSTAGKKYSVTVTGASMPIAYDVEFADCK
jgi:uncharacterized protein YkwD